MVSKHHCGQIFGTYLSGWEGRSHVRRRSGVQPRNFFVDDFLSIFGRYFLVLKDKILGSTECPKIRSQRDQETQYFEAVSLRGKD